MRQGVEACDAKQIKIEILDNKVLEIFSRISQDPSLVHNYVKKHVAPVSHGDPAEINKKINACKTRIGRLTESLSESSGSSAAKYIVTEIERIDLEIQVLSREYAAAIMAQKKSKQEVKSSEDIVSEISDFIANFDNFTAKERNDIVKDVIKECVWDGTTLSVVI
jgi:site-specific DNA recombinase